MMPLLPEPNVEIISGHREPFVFYDSDQMREYGQACADAEGERLESAAPDLLEALQDLFIDCMACDYNDGFNTSPLAKKVRAAIAKATGGAA